MDSTTARQPDAWHGWASLDNATYDALLRLDSDTFRAVWDATPRVAIPSPRLRDGSPDHYIGASQETAQDAGHVVTRWDDDDAALVDEWDVNGWDEWVSDDVVTCWASVRLSMGEPLHKRSAGRVVAATARTEYATGRRFVASATGEPSQVRRLRRNALQDAQAQATSHRTAQRASLSVLGRDDDARGAGWVDSATYRQVRGAVMRHVYGNASRVVAGASLASHVRAGIAANGMPVDAHCVDDATQYACMILRRWVVAGMPDSLSAIVDDADTDSACRALIGAAARDGLRMTTQHKRATTLAQQTAAYVAGRASHVNTDDGAQVQPSRAVPVRLGSKGHTTGRGWVADSADSLRTDALLARLSTRDSAGRVAYPALLALFLSDGNTDDALRSLGRIGANGRPSGAARRAFLSACRAEWDALSDGTTADDSAEWVDSLTYAR